jgi:iron(III) transport system substrate-binding protein
MRRVKGWRRARLASVLVVAVSVTVACGDSGGGSDTSDDDSTAAVEKAADNQAADRQEVLEAGAAEEGDLFVYTAMGLDDFNTFSEGFNELYPDINLTVFSGTGEKAVQRTLTEYQAGEHSVDVIFAPTTDIGYLAKADYLQEYYSPNTPEGVDQKALSGVPVYVNRFVLAWNTDAVSEGDVPSSYEDLLDPKWKGQVGIEAGDVPWMATLFQEWGEEEGKQYFEGLGAQEPFVQDSHTTLAELVASGEVPLSPTVYDYDAEGLKLDGAPIDWKPLDPLVAYPYVVSLPKYAPHPNASMLFIDYMLSQEGQQGIADLGRTPANPEVPPALEGLKAMGDIPIVSIDPVTWSDGIDGYDDIWQQTMRN